MVIGSITETQKLIDDSLKLEQEGVELNMCKILEELEERGREKGRIEGRVEGAIKIYKKMEASREDTIKNIMENFSLDKEVADKYVEELLLNYIKFKHKNGVIALSIVLFELLL